MVIELNNRSSGTISYQEPLESGLPQVLETLESGSLIVSSAESSVSSACSIYCNFKKLQLQAKKIKILKENIRNLGELIDQAPNRKARKPLKKKLAKLNQSLLQEQLKKSELKTKFQVSCIQSIANATSLYYSLSDQEQIKLATCISKFVTNGIRFCKQPIAESIACENTLKEKAYVSLKQGCLFFHYGLLTTANAIKAADFMELIDKEDPIAATILSYSYLSTAIHTTLTVTPLLWNCGTKFFSENSNGVLLQKAREGFETSQHYFKIASAWGKWVNSYLTSSCKILCNTSQYAISGIDLMRKTANVSFLRTT